MAERRDFLSAEWRDLVMLNYEVEPGILRQYVPSGVELDTFHGRTFVSLVGFGFCAPSFTDSWQFPSTAISTK